MLQQILKTMYIEPELLAELDEEQKQLLFCKMREEQVRKWQLNDALEKEDRDPKKSKDGGKKVSFKLGLDGEPVVAVIGSDPDEEETMLQEKAKQQADLEGDALRLAAEEELDKLVNMSHSSIQQMEASSITEKRDPTREAIVKSLQEATQELEDKMRSETVEVIKPQVADTNEIMKIDVNFEKETKVILNTKIPIDSDKSTVINIRKEKESKETYFKENSQNSKDVPLKEISKNIIYSKHSQESKSNREKLKESNIVSENNTPPASLYLTSDNTGLTGQSSSMFTIRSMTSNPISDFPKRNKPNEDLLGVAAHVKQFERLSNSSLEALKTATLERAKKRRQKEILDYLRQQADLSSSKEPEEIAWREQERKAKNAEKRIRDIARRAREEHRRVSSSSDDRVSENINSKKSNQIEDINGNMKINLEKSENIKLRQAELKRSRIENSKPEILSKPTAPPSRRSIIDWYKLQELPKGSGIDSSGQRVSDWFHGIISRNDAEEILLKEDVGSFLVRISERIWGYVVSYRSNDRCRHYLIDITEGNYAFLGSYKNTHPALRNLIDYHQSNPIATSGDDSEHLIKACSQKPPVNVYEELFKDTVYKYS